MSDRLSIANESQDVEFLVEPSKRKMVKKARVTLRGKLNLYNAAFISEKLRLLTDQYDILDFRLEEVAEIDISAIQAMYYYKTICGKQQEKSISFQMLELPAEVSAIINKCKYNKALYVKPAVTSK